MTIKRKKLKSWKSDTIPVNNMVMRMVSVIPETANDDERAIDVIIATETPVERMDPERGYVFREILDMDGIQLRRPDLNRLPIVDSHDRSTVRNVFGSIRELRVENIDGVGPGYVGRAMFADDEESQNAYRKMRDGHLTDFSITASPFNTEEIRRGETGVFRKQQINGPAVIHHGWTPTDASLVAAGADENSTVRELLRSYQTNYQLENEEMDEQTRADLLAMGMPESITTTAEALAWLMAQGGDEVENMDGESTDDTERQDDTAADDVENMDDDSDVENADDDTTETTVENTVQRALAAERKRTREIYALCKKAGIKRAFADQLCNKGVTIDVAREKVLERMVDRKPIGTSAGVTVTRDAQDQFNDAVRDGIIARAMLNIPTPNGQRRNVNDVFGNNGPAAGFDDFQNMGLFRIADEILRRGNITTNRMTKKDIALVALGHRPTISRMEHAGLIQRSSAAYHTTGLLPNLMLDAANKTLLTGYEEAAYTWSMWARQGTSVPDFKSINRIRFSESPDLEHVPENKNYPEGKHSDQRETYKVEKFGRVFTVTWETVVNDDMDAISRIPQMHGNAARRTQNKQVYAVLTDNANMSDGVALFNASHSNLAGSGGVINTANMNAAFAAMRTQTGINSDAIINVIPAFLIVPAAIAATAYQFVGSIADPSQGGDTTGNANVTNIYGPNGPRRLAVVEEPQLDGNSTTAWYLAAANTQVDTVELTFLQGEESPVLENEWDFDKDVYKFKIRQTFGTKSIDHRGLYKNPGA